MHDAAWEKHLELQAGRCRSGNGPFRDAAGSVSRTRGNDQFIEGDSHGKEIEASEGQEDSARETADETCGFAGREALNQVLGPPRDSSIRLLA